MARMDREQREEVINYLRFCDEINGPISRPLLLPRSVFYSVPTTIEHNPADYVDIPALKANANGSANCVLILKWKEDIDQIPLTLPCSSRLLFSFCLKIILCAVSHS